MKPTLRSFILLASLLLCTSCEKDNVDAADNIKLDLKATESGGGFITINGNTSFDFTLTVPNNKVGIVVWQVDDIKMPIRFNFENQIAYINVRQIEPGLHTLKAKVYLFDRNKVDKIQNIIITPEDIVAKEFSYNLNYKALDIDINVTIKFEGVNSSETIYIYDETLLRYQVLIDRGGLEYINWKIEDQSLHAYHDNGSWTIHINHREFTAGKEYTLTAQVYVKVPLPSPGGGTTEDKVIEKILTFKIKILEQSQLLNIRQAITDDGHLKIEWNKPDLEQLPIDRYEVSYLDKNGSGMKEKAIHNPEETFFIDEDYVYGQQIVTVKVVYVGDKIKPWSENYTVKYTEITPEDIIIEEVDLNKLRLNFNFPPYTSQCYLNFDAGGPLQGIKITPSDLPLEISRPMFPDKLALRINLYSARAENYYNPQHIIKKSFYYDHIATTDNANLGYIASPYDNRMYIVGRERLTAIDAQTLEEINSISYQNTITMNFVADNASTRKVIQDKNDVRIYKDGSFTNPVYFQINIGNSVKSVLGFLPDHMLIAAVISGKNRIINIYHPDSGDFVETISLPKDYPISSEIKYSNNYLSIQYDKKLEIFQLEGYKATLLKTFSDTEISTSYMNHWFHHYNGKSYIIAFLKSVGKPAFIELSSFTTEVIDGWYGSTDPVTGNIALFSSDASGTYLHIWKGDRSKELFKFKADLEQYNCMLFNSIYYDFSNTNGSWINYIDLSKYITL